MGIFTKGDLVVARVPFSDISGSKIRPAVVVAELKGEDLILCGVTASRSDCYSVNLGNEDLAEGTLRFGSNVRANVIFTVESNQIPYRIGHLKQQKICEIEEKLVEIFTS